MIGRRATRAAVGAACLVAALVTGTGHAAAGTGPVGGSWPYPNGDLSNTRVAVDSSITAASVARLAEAWSFHLSGRAARSLDHTGSLVSNPVVVGGVVFVQDLRSNVYALALATGTLLWEHRFDEKLLSGPGPNGVAVSGGVVYGFTPHDAFALRASDGRLVWMDRHLLSPGQGTFGIQPQVTGGRVYAASQYGLSAGGGVLLALRASDGEEIWRFNTTRREVPGVRAAGLGSGGAWETPLVGPDGTVTYGTGNPYQSIGSALADPTRQLYTDSEVALDAQTGRLEWYFQAVPDDFKDYDLQTSPMAATVAGRALVIASGKMGIVYALDARTGRLVWKRPVGEHDGHDDDSLDALEHRGVPTLPFSYLPGSLGGVLANLAVAGSSVYVETLNVELRYTSDSQVTGVPTARTREGGDIEALSLATGRVEWSDPVSSLPLGAMTVVNDLVLTTLYDGRLLALSRATGRVVLARRLPTSTNAPLAVAGDYVIVPCGGPATGHRSSEGRPQVVAYRLGPVPTGT